MLEATVTIDLDDQIGTVEPGIYGHFIEHLGRCITGGIHAEMLRSRRFVGFDDDHNGIADPWSKVGGKAPHLLIEPPASTEGGWLTMRCLRDTGTLHQIEHPGLAVRKGDEYVVSVELRTTGDISAVQISLAGDAMTLAARGSEGATVTWTARARWDSDDAALTIGCRGEGEMQVRAPSVIAAPDAASGGFRADVVELVRAINPPVIRWPGGCFADGYRWRDGVGDRVERPARFDPAWRAWDDNDFGTEEFVRFCGLVGAEPCICVNTGSADAESAAGWVRFCRERDLNVRWWGVGNETYGGWEIGNVSADEYGRLFLEFAEAMRAQDPEIELIAVGADPVDYPDWNRTVLEIAGDQIDHLSVHRYVPHTREDQDRERQYRAIVAAPLDVERRLRLVAETIDDVLGPDSGVGIAFDEWNVWLDATGGEGIEETYELRDALFAAGVFHAMHRMGDRLSMANLAQLVNVLPAITTTQTKAWGTAIYRAFELYRQCEGAVIACSCECPTFDLPGFGNIPEIEDVPWLDASATLSEDGKLVALGLLNRHPSEQFEVSIEAPQDLHAVARATLSGAGAGVCNSAEMREAVAVVETECELNETATIAVGPHSATVVTLSVES